MLTDSLRIAQVVSLGLIIGAIFTIWFRRGKGLKNYKYKEDSSHQNKRLKN